MGSLGNIATSILKAKNPSHRRIHRRRRDKSPPRNETQSSGSHALVVPNHSLIPNLRLLQPSIKTNDAQAIATVMAHGLAKSTQGNYTHALNAYLGFCDNRRINESLRFPACEKTLCAFAASLATSKSGSAATGIFSGLKMWHSLHNVPWHGSSRLQIVLKGVAALAPASSKQAQRDPVSAEMITELYTDLNLDDPFDAAVFAAASIAFWGQARLGELLGTSRLHHTPSKLPSRSSISPSFSAAGSREIFLPCTKTRQHEGEKMIILRQSGPADPIQAIEKHFSVNHQIPPNHHLFAFVVNTRAGPSNRCLTKEGFLTRCNEIWNARQRPRFTGHCFRIGGTTELLLRGVDPEIVRTMGRWASDAHLRYWRKTRHIAAAQAEKLPPYEPSNAQPSGAKARRVANSRAARPATHRGRPY